MPLKLVPPRKGKSPNYTVRGTYLRQYVDQSTGTGEVRVAKKVLERIKRQIETGAFSKPTGPTFADAALRYMEAGGERRKYTMGRLLMHFGTKPLAEVNQEAIDAAAQELYPNASPATRNRQVYTVVSAVLKHAGIEQPLRRPKGALGVQKTDWLWPEQAFKLFREADKIDPEFGVFLRLLCYTGLRLSEALNLRWNDVRLDEGFAFIPDTKAGNPRPVYVPPTIVVALKALQTQRTYVFRFSKSGRLYSLLKATRSAAFGRGQGSGVSFHVLRHTWATWMRRYGGLDTKGLVATGAWRDPASASRYAHAVSSEEAMKAALLPTEDEE